MYMNNDNATRPRILVQLALRWEKREPFAVKPTIWIGVFAKKLCLFYIQHHSVKKVDVKENFLIFPNSLIVEICI